MIVYVGAGSGPYRDLVIAAGHGQMVSRQAGAFRIPKRGRWAFDNGAYTDWSNHVPFNTNEFLRRLETLSHLEADRLPDFAVCPDMVGSRMSLAHSLEWIEVCRSFDPRLRWYLALQDGFHPEDVEHALGLEKWDGFFVGGTTDWKMKTSPGWVEFGHRHGLPVHIGRVNGPGRLRWAVTIEADSVDGTGWVKAGERWLPYLQNMPRALVRIPTRFPEEDLEFGAFLSEIYGEKDWSSWRRNEADDPAHYERIAEMGPERFELWVNAAYGLKNWPVRVPDFRSLREFQDWKKAVLWELEHFHGKRRTPPKPS